MVEKAKAPRTQIRTPGGLVLVFDRKAYQREYMRKWRKRQKRKGGKK